MKKVAVLIRGHVRNYAKLKKSFDFFTQPNDNYEYTMFVHTWNTVNYSSAEIIDIEAIKNFYNTINIIVEEQKYISTTCVYFMNNRNRDKFKFQLYSIYNVHKMMLEYEQTNNVKFDYVYHTRFDMLYNTKLCDIIKTMDEKEADIVTPYKFVYYDLNCLIRRVNSDKYSNMILYDFKKIKKIYKSYGINCIIKYLIDKNNWKHLNQNFAFITR